MWAVLYWTNTYSFCHVSIHKSCSLSLFTGMIQFSFFVYNYMKILQLDREIKCHSWIKNVNCALLHRQLGLIRLRSLYIYPQFWIVSKAEGDLYISPVRFLLLMGEDLHLPCIRQRHLGLAYPLIRDGNQYFRSEEEEVKWLFKTISRKKVTKDDSGEYTCSSTLSHKKTSMVTVIGQ